MNDPYQLFPPIIKQVIEEFDLSQFFTGLGVFLKNHPDTYATLTSDPKIKVQPSALKGLQLMISFLDAHIYSDRPHQLLASATELSEELSKNVGWLTFHEKCVEFISMSLSLFQASQSLLETSEHTTPEFFKNPWHSLCLKVLRKNPYLVQNKRVVPIFLPKLQQESPFKLDQLPKENDLAIVNISTRNFPLAERALDFVNPDKTLWFFDSCSAFFYALSSLKLYQTLFDSEGNAKAPFMIATVPVERTLKEKPSWKIERCVPLYDFTKHKIKGLNEELKKSIASWFNGSIDNSDLDLVKEAYGRGIEFERLGKNATLPLLFSYISEDWSDPYKLERRNRSHALNAERQIQEKLLSQTLPAKAPKDVKKNLPRIVHIASQLVDKGHSPTRIIKNIMLHHNLKKYDVALLVCEDRVLRSTQYPHSPKIAQASTLAGNHAIDLLKELKTPFYVDTAEGSIEESADRIVEKLKIIAPDVIIYHGPSPTHHLIAAKYPHAKSIMFEHGTLPNLPGFDVALTSLEDSPELFGEALKKIKTEVKVLPFFSDSRRQWKDPMPTKSFLGAEEDSMIATTITNHMEARFSEEFCWTISEILHQCPNIHYVPLGKVEDKNSLLKRFPRKDTHDQIHFFGHTQAPSQLTRVMDFYYNEFPFGSCIGMLDAMASGCPAVTMYDPSGPPQYRYGGMFMGMDKAITSLKKEDYVEAAVSLAKDPHKYFIWSQHAFQVYEGRSNLEGYVAKLEEIIEKLLN